MMMIIIVVAAAAIVIVVVIIIIVIIVIVIIIVIINTTQRNAFNVLWLVPALIYLAKKNTMVQTYMETDSKYVRSLRMSVN